MEPTEQIAYVIVLSLAFLMIVWGLLKLRGTGLLKRGHYPDSPEREERNMEDFYDSDNWWDSHFVTEDFTESDYELGDFPKNQEDDSKSP